MTLVEISQHFLKKIITSKEFNKNTAYSGIDLLFPEFYETVKLALKEFNSQYPDIEVIFVETYRSNILQMIHFNNKASKIKKDGMHHFGIAADCAFKINGKFSYQGDYKFLRKCFTDQGLSLLGIWDAGHVQGIPVDMQQQLRNQIDSDIRDFQSGNNLKVDGVIGPKTINKAKEIFTKSI